MKRKKRNPESTSSIESIGEHENRSEESEEEDVERDYQGRSEDQEDGVVPMDPADQKRLPKDEVRSPTTPPRNNI